MPGNGKVFISHAHADNARCQPLLAALTAWGVDYWFDAQNMDAGQDLSTSIQQAIEERDIFIRVCTPAAQASYWMRLEAGAFRGLQAQQQTAGRPGSRTLINLILDHGYTLEPFDYAGHVINGASRPFSSWLPELRAALGLDDLPTTDPYIAHPAHAAPSNGWTRPPSTEPAPTDAFGLFAAVHEPLTAYPSDAFTLTGSHDEPLLARPAVAQRLPRPAESRAASNRLLLVGAAILLVLVSFAGVAVAGGRSGLLAFGRPGGAASPTLPAHAKATGSPTRVPTATVAPTATPIPVPTDTPMPTIQFPPTSTPRPEPVPGFWAYSSTTLPYSIIYPKAWSINSGDDYTNNIHNPDEEFDQAHFAWVGMLSVCMCPSGIGVSQILGVAQAQAYDSTADADIGKSIVGGNTVSTSTETLGGLVWARTDYDTGTSKGVILAIHHGGHAWVIRYDSPTAQFAADERTIYTPMVRYFQFTS